MNTAKLTSEILATGMRQTQIAEYCGVSQSTVARWVKGIDPEGPNRDKLLELHHRVVGGVSRRELQYIRDEDEKPETSEEYAQGYTRDHWKPKLPGALPELDISAGAGEGKIGNVIVLPLDGGGVSAHEVVDEWPLPMTWLHEAVNDVRQSLVVKVVGESMTPNYLPGDRVIVDLSQDRFVSDSVYLISDGESAPQIKRLQRVPLTVPTRVTIISDNPAYQNHEVEVDLLRIHGRVCAHVGRT